MARVYNITRLLARQPLVWGFVLVALFIMATPFLGTNPFAINLDNLFAGPSGSHFLGTDELGRDVFSRLLMGMRLSVYVGVVVVLVSGVVGITIGLISGYVGGWVDTIIMRITDIFLAFPGILLAIAFASLLGPGVENVILALCLMSWVGFARLSRAEALRLRHQPFVEAAQVSGATPGRIIIRHVLPNAAAPLIVEGIFATAGAMIAEAGLSFLGLGVQPPDPSLGAMLREGARYMIVAPHLVLAPGLALMALVLGLNIIGDRLRDKLDARSA